MADPSKMEAKVMEQVAGRVMNHEMRNQARKLTPAERKDKRRRKLEEDTSKEVRESGPVFFLSFSACPHSIFHLSMFFCFLSGACDLLRGVFFTVAPLRQRSLWASFGSKTSPTPSTSSR